MITGIQHGNTFLELKGTLSSDLQGIPQVGPTRQLSLKNLNRFETEILLGTIEYSFFLTLLPFFSFVLIFLS